MVTCTDTSFLFAIYADDTHTPRATDWIRTQRAALTVTAFNELELANALRFAEWRRAVSPGDAERFLKDYDADRLAGRIVLRECNLAAVIDEARRLSVVHTIAGGHRTFDILHVAAAIVIGADRFLTFDGNQKRLATAAGLDVPL